MILNKLGTSISLIKKLPPTKDTNYVSSDFHAEIIYPDKSIMWITSPSVQVSNSSAPYTDPDTEEIIPGVEGSLTYSTPTLSEAGLYRITLLYKTQTDRYSKVGSAIVKVPESDVYYKSEIALNKTTVQKSYNYVSQAFI